MDYKQAWNAYRRGHTHILTEGQIWFFGFIEDHPDFVEHFGRVLDEVRFVHGKTHYRRAMILMKMRWDLSLKFEDGAHPYAINDHLRSHMARLCTDFGITPPGFFRIRKSGKPEREEATVRAGKWL